MSQNRLGDYLEHIEQAASDACVFIEGLSKDDFIDQYHAARQCHQNLFFPRLNHRLGEQAIRPAGT